MLTQRDTLQSLHVSECPAAFSLYWPSTGAGAATVLRTLHIQMKGQHVFVSAVKKILKP